MVHVFDEKESKIFTSVFSKEIYMNQVSKWEAPKILGIKNISLIFESFIQCILVIFTPVTMPS